MVSTTCFSDFGDSGGAVKVERNMNGFIYTYCAGIIKGGKSSGEMFYTDMDKAKAALGFSGYYDKTGYK